MKELDRLERHPNRLGKYYIISTKFKWKEIGDVESYQRSEWFRTSLATQTRNPTEEYLRNKAYEAALDYARSRTAVNYEPEITQLEIIKIEQVPGVKSLRSMPVYRYRLSYPNLGLHDNQMQSYNSCGFRILLKEYPKKAKSIEDLEDFFDKPRTEGLTPDEILKFCQYHGLNCYIMDLSSNAIVKHVQSNEHITDRHKDRENHALIATVGSEHYYLITNPEIRRKITNNVMEHTWAGEIQGQNVIEKKDGSTEREHRLVKYLPEILEEKVDYYLETTDLTDMYLKFLG